MGFSQGRNIYGDEIGTGESSLYLAGAVPGLKGLGIGLKATGAAVFISGVTRVYKKAFGIPVLGGASKKALLSSVLARLGLIGAGYGVD